MPAQDFSKSLFSFRGSFPTQLPRRFFIGKGQSRYSNCVSLDDCHTAGYFGPIDPPPQMVDPGFHVDWDKNQLKFIVVPDKTDEDIYTLELQNKLKELEGLIEYYKNCELVSTGSQDLDYKNEINRTKVISTLTERFSRIYTYPELPDLSINGFYTAEHVPIAAALLERLTVTELEATKNLYVFRGESIVSNYPLISGSWQEPDSWIRGSGTSPD